MLRQLVDYGRLGEPWQAEALNELYAKEWSQFRNFFCPAMKHLRTESEGSKKRRIYDQPTTRFERLKACSGVDPTGLAALESVYASINPFQLKRLIETKLRKLMRQPTRAAACSPKENRHRNGVFFQSPCGLLPEHPISMAYGVLFIEPTNTYFFSSPVSFLIEPTREENVSTPARRWSVSSPSKGSGAVIGWPASGRNLEFKERNLKKKKSFQFFLSASQREAFPV